VKITQPMPFCLRAISFSVVLVEFMGPPSRGILDAPDVRGMLRAGSAERL
jgi:hypothetical protein